MGTVTVKFLGDFHACAVGCDGVIEGIAVVSGAEDGSFASRDIRGGGVASSVAVTVYGPSSTTTTLSRDGTAGASGFRMIALQLLQYIPGLGSSTVFERPGIFGVV